MRFLLGLVFLTSCSQPSQIESASVQIPPQPPQQPAVIFNHSNANIVTQNVDADQLLTDTPQTPLATNTFVSSDELKTLSYEELKARVHTQKAKQNAVFEENHLLLSSMIHANRLDLLKRWLKEQNTDLRAPILRNSADVTLGEYLLQTAIYKKSEETVTFFLEQNIGTDSKAYTAQPDAAKFNAFLLDAQLLKEPEHGLANLLSSAMLTRDSEWVKTLQQRNYPFNKDDIVALLNAISGPTHVERARTVLQYLSAEDLNFAIAHPQFTKILSYGSPFELAYWLKKGFTINADQTYINLLIYAHQHLNQELLDHLLSETYSQEQSLLTTPEIEAFLYTASLYDREVNESIKLFLRANISKAPLSANFNSWSQRGDDEFRETLNTYFEKS